MANVRTRKDVWKLADWDPDLLWYAKAIAEMKKRPFKDPTSWRYQAAIHDYDPGSDPLSSQSDPPPPAANQKDFWKKCQHFSWFFLPWHRMYLHYFEQIVGATVVKLGGPADWALPYWNYSDASNHNARKLPHAFIAKTLPDGGANALRVEDRDAGNDGAEVAGPREVDIRPCLSEPVFEAGSTGAEPGFGGPATGFNHDDGRVGSLEGTPHGSMHVAVGGWMGSFNTAGLDPIFWLHHANIDRLWQVWLNRDSKNVNPTKAAWLTKLAFDFHDSTGKKVSLKPAQVLDTTASPLFYKYQDVSDPLGHAHKPLTEEERTLTMSDRIAEMIGATDKPVSLRGGVAHTSFSAKKPTGPAHLAAEANVPGRMYLNFENIKGTGKPVSYAVYLNLPPDAKPSDHEELYVGILPMFGVAEASRAGSDHPGSGIHYSLEASAVIRTLESKNDWDPANIRVTFVPETGRVRRELVASPGAIEVGRVSLYAK